ncbi:MAG TPA: hypothetical protein VN380_18740 [Thermoanaerobaculia bacterium]|jgi:hypothetical protein|nr:hypothetical protein [Thermoanaerobaculia bacterium]
MHHRALLRGAGLFVLVAAASLAAAGTTIVVDTVTSNLPPGTHVRVEAGGEYRLLEFAPLTPEERSRPSVSRTAGDQNVKFRLAADAPLVWEFVVPANGVVAPKQFRLSFSKDLGAAPRGMAASVTFPIKYTISIPARAGKPAIQGEQISTRASMHIPADGRWVRCLRVESWDIGIFVGLTAECTNDLRKDPSSHMTPAPK